MGQQAELAQMEQEARNMMHQGVEYGYIVCRKGKVITHGRESTGDPTHVTIDTRCPAGARPIALFHSHPNTGNIQPSDVDLREARRHGIPNVCVGIPEDGRVKCYKVPGVA